MGTLQPRETFYLYLSMVGFSFLLFALGVYVGKTYYADAQADGQKAQAEPAAAAAGEDAPESPEQPELDFYRDLVEDKEKETGAGQGQPSPQPSGASSEKAAGEQAGGELSTGFTVQVGAVNSRGDADKLLQRLGEKGYQAFIVTPDFSRDSFYRVWVGKFAAEAEAREMSGRLKADGFQVYVKRVRFPAEGDQ